MEFKTADEMGIQISKFMDKYAENLGGLRFRWKHESEYEDFEDYKNVIKKLLQEFGLKASSISKAFVIKIPFNKASFFQIKVYLNGKITTSFYSC